jgi:transcriptional regulator with XRE-family HTH domain
VEDNVKIGKRIESRRKEIGYTQEQVANSIGVVKSTIQRYEKGLIKEPKLPILQAIARAIQVNPEWLILKTDIKELPTDTQKQLLISNYDKLNDLGRKKLVDYSNDLISSTNYL